MTENPPALEIADRPELLTPGWITDALTAAGSLREAFVAGVRLHPLGTGQMCDSWRVTLTYEGSSTGPATLVAKLPAADATSRATAQSLRSYEREVRFYQQLASELPVTTPAVFYADVEPATASFVLLLEDIAPATQGDQLAGCSPEVAEVAIAELVRLHAPRWNDESLHSIEWLYGDPVMSKQMLLMLLPALWQGFCARYATVLESHVHEAGVVLFARLAEYLMPTPNETIVHGDYRLDNLLLDPDLGAARPLTVVDWQTCGVNNAMQDVAYFIGAGLLEDDRRAVEDRLVRTYHELLSATGVAGYKWDECWRDYRRGTWAGLIMAVAASMMVERTERGDQMFMTMASRHARHALDLDAADVIGR